MNTEPVAWMWNEDGCNLGVVLDQDKQMGNEFNDYTIPLYTHPAKTLTDEEIIALWNDMVDRQLLRKAQEK